MECLWKGTDIHIPICKKTNLSPAKCDAKNANNRIWQSNQKVESNQNFFILLVNLNFKGKGLLYLRQNNQIEHFSYFVRNYSVSLSFFL